MKLRGEVFSDRFDIPNRKRTYFFNIKRNREGDLFLNLVESLKKFDDNFDRQEIVIYEEHIEEFRDKIDAVIQTFLEIRDRKEREE